MKFLRLNKPVRFTVAGLCLFCALLLSISAFAVAPPLELISINQAQSGSGNKESSAQMMTPDGRYVVFTSSADNLVAGDYNNASDNFVRDRLNGVTTLVSINMAGTASGNGVSKFPSLSNDGRYVAFVSNAGDLVFNDHNNVDDVFVRDMQTGTTTLASVSALHGASGSNDSPSGTISANGRFVVFGSNAIDIAPNDTNGWRDVFVRDMQAGVTSLVSVNSAGTATGNNSSDLAGISADGRFVLFTSAANNLVSNDTNTVYDIYLRDMQTGTTRLVSINSAGTASGNSGSFGPAALTPDGRYVLFVSLASNLAPNDGNSQQDTFVRDMQTGTTLLVSLNQTGTAAGNAGTGGGIITADGRYVAFTSLASDLAPNDTNTYNDLFLRDIQTGTTRLVSLNSAGTESGNSHSTTPAVNTVSADGRYVAFISRASNLAPNDTNNINNYDVFVRDMQTQMTTLVSRNIAGTASGNGNSVSPLLSADGRFLAFTSNANDLIANDNNGFMNDVFLFDVQQSPTQEQLQFAAPIYNTNESGMTATITVNRVSGVTGTITTTYATGSGTATPGSDYTPVTGTLVFAPEENSKSFTIPVLEDSVNEATESVSLSLSGNSSRAALMIQDNDLLPALTVNDVSITEGNSGLSYARMTVTLTPASEQTSSVLFGTVPDTASPNEDYAPVYGSLTFAPGETTRTVDVPIIGDTKFETDESLKLFISTPVNATIADDRGVCTIINDDSSALSITLEDAVLIEGDNGTMNMGFKARLSAPSNLTIGFSYTTVPTGSATQDVDYGWVGGGGGFWPGQTQTTLVVPIKGDLIDEPDETFIMRIAQPNNGAVIVRNEATGTITDNDPEPSLNINDVRVTEARNGTYAAVFNAKLSAPSGKTVTVNYATSDGTAIGGQDYQPLSGQLTFGPGQTSKNIIVLVEADALEEGDETFILNLTDVANASLARGQGICTITNYRKRVASDFDGDGETDIAVFRPTDGYWYITQSSIGAFRAEAFGASVDKIVPADYDGDGKTDIAVFRPSTGYWYFTDSSTGAFRFTQFGQTGDLPAPGDYDGDGKADICLYRPSTSTFYFLRSTDGVFQFLQWGQAGDLPLMGDYDGDSRTDFTIYRPSTSDFYIRRSSDGGVIGQQWGAAGDKPVTADFDGDGKSEIAIFRPSTGEWYYLQSSDSTFKGISWGTSGDIPATGDYDGDDKWDVAIFRPSAGVFYILQSTTSSLKAEQFGTNGDVPVPSAYAPF